MNGPTLDRLGVPGIIGLGLMLFGLSLYLGTVAPAQNELANLKLEESQLRAAYSPPPAGTDATAGAARSSRVEAILSIAELPEVIKELNYLAEQHGVTIDRISSDLNERDGQRRLEIDLPLKSGYLSLRAYLRDVLTMEKAPVLDELTLKRQQSSDPAVEAALRLSYAVAASP